jgi:hypothetical protein
VPATPLTFDAVIQGWLVEKKPNEKTEYSCWRRVTKELSEFLGHDDARRVSADDLVGRKTDLLQRGVRPRPFRDSKLAPYRLSLSRFMSYLPLLSFRPSAIVSGSAYLLSPPFGMECLTSLADDMAHYALC